MRFSLRTLPGLLLLLPSLANALAGIALRDDNGIISSTTVETETVSSGDGFSTVSVSSGDSFSTVLVSSRSAPVTLSAGDTTDVITSPTKTPTGDINISAGGESTSDVLSTTLALTTGNATKTMSTKAVSTSPPNSTASSAAAVVVAAADRGMSLTAVIVALAMGIVAF